MADIVYDAEKNAKEYKDLNVQINALKKRIKNLKIQDSQATVDKTVEINAANAELEKFEEKRKANREASQKYIESTQVEAKTKKTANTIDNLSKEIDYINKTGNVKPTKDQRVPVKASDEYLQNLIQKRDSLKTGTPTGPAAVAEIAATTGSTGSRVGAFDSGTPNAISGKPEDIILGVNLTDGSVGQVDTGLFNVPGITDSVLFLSDPRGNGKYSRPKSVSEYRKNIYAWTPESVVAYKKAMNYGNTSSFVDSKFADAVVAKAQEVSENNYYNALNGKPVQIAVENFIANPGKYGGSVGSGGVTVKAEELKAKTATVKQLTTELGVTLSDKEIKDLAYKYASGAIDANTIKYQVAKAGNIDYTKGTAASTVTELKKLAADNGIDYNDAWFQTAAGNIITGRSTLDTLKADINNQAKGIYSAESIQKGIDAGFSVRAQASPYITYLANIRGVDPENVSLKDPFISQAFTARDDKGNPTVMSYFDFRKNVRQNDPQWGYSDEAQTETTSMLRKFGQVFGKSF